MIAKNKKNMTDEQIAAALREVVGLVNHFVNMAVYRRLSVQLSFSNDGSLPIITNCVVARPILAPKKA